MAVDALSPEEIDQQREQIIATVSQLEYVTNDMPREDLSIFLDINPRLAYKLLEKRKSTPSEKDEATDHIDLQERIYNEYQWMTTNQPDHYIKVECTKDNNLLPIETISQLVWEKVTTQLPQLSKTP
jgi:thymidylate kinase